MNSRVLRTELLESRYCLSSVVLPPGVGLEAGLVRGNLVVSGVADEAVEIQAVGQGSFNVTKGDQLVDHVENVTGGIRMNVHAVSGEGGETADSGVTVDLNGTQVDWILAVLGGDSELTVQDGEVSRALHVFGRAGDDAVAVRNVAVDSVMAFLGHGNDVMELDGEISRSVFIRGGRGDDSVAVGATIGGSLAALLGHGTNQLEMNGEVGGRFLYRAGDGDDTLLIGDSPDVDPEVGRGAVAFLGHGDNTVQVDGQIGRSLVVNGGIGKDTVTLSPTAEVSMGLFARLGAGLNNLELLGNVGRGVRYVGSAGVDQMFIDDQANVGGTIRATMGTGYNWVEHRGTVGGHFVVTTANETDTERIDFSQGTVNGRTVVRTLDPQSGNVLRRKIVILPSDSDVESPAPSLSTDPSSGPSKQIG